MKYLILLMFIFGCGVDPDDYQAEESDGCKSDDVACQEAVKEAGVEEEGKEEEKETGEEKGLESIVVESEVTVKTKVVIGANGEEISEDDADNCQAGRIYRGSTKSEVVSLLGYPDTLEKEDPFETWSWYALEDVVCGGFNCTISFREGLVVEQERINTRWLDLENF